MQVSFTIHTELQSERRISQFVWIVILHTKQKVTSYIICTQSLAIPQVEFPLARGKRSSETDLFHANQQVVLDESQQYITINTVYKLK